MINVQVKKLELEESVIKAGLVGKWVSISTHCL